MNDNAKGKASSAGAQLRRYGEQALREVSLARSIDVPAKLSQQDIRGLLEEWSEDLDDCERIWLRASGSNRKIFVDYDGSSIAKNDTRLRTFPFPTRRPVGFLRAVLTHKNKNSNARRPRQN